MTTCNWALPAFKVNNINIVIPSSSSVALSSAAAPIASVPSNSTNVTGLMSGWTALGSRKDNVNGRAPNVDAYCTVRRHTMVGLKDARACYCGSATLADDKCNVACTGDNSRMCGGADALIMFITSTPGKTRRPTSAASTSTRTCSELLLWTVSAVDGCSTPPSLLWSITGAGSEPPAAHLSPSVSLSPSLLSTRVPIRNIRTSPHPSRTCGHVYGLSCSSSLSTLAFRIPAPSRRIILLGLLPFGGQEQATRVDLYDVLDDSSWLNDDTTWIRPLSLVRSGVRT